MGIEQHRRPFLERYQAFSPRLEYYNSYLEQHTRVLEYDKQAELPLDGY
jgi:hypothetical protein